jgi:hypothetical protein
MSTQCTNCFSLTITTTRQQTSPCQQKAAIRSDPAGFFQPFVSAASLFVNRSLWYKIPPFGTLTMNPIGNRAGAFFCFS